MVCILYILYISTKGLPLIKSIGKRALINLFTLWLIISASFSIIKLAPGNPFEQERAVSEETMRALKEKFDFGYTEYLLGILQGDFRYSYAFPDQKVGDLILEALPVSLELGFLAMSIALFFGLLLGALSASLRGTKWDSFLMLAALGGIAIPNFVLGPLLQLLFGIHLQILPVAGWFGAMDRILPVLTLAMMYVAYIARISRSSFLETLKQDYIATAQAKGLSPRTILGKHALRNSILPVVHFIAPATAAILSGTMVIEKIFTIPGLGRHFVNSALQRDYPLALGVIIVYSILLLSLNFIADLVSTLIDPRITLD